MYTAETLDLPIRDIDVRNRARALDEEKVTDLKFSIERDGLLQPIGVGLLEGVYVLGWGGHRLEAMKRLGHATISTRLFRDLSDPSQLRRLELSENLFRNDLSLLERAVHLKEYLAADRELRQLSAEEIADKLGISRRMFFYYKQVASLPQQQVDRILALPQDMKDSRPKLLDFFKLPSDELRDQVLDVLEKNDETDYPTAKGAVMKIAIESKQVERAHTITRVQRTRMHELKKVLADYYAYRNVNQADLVDWCLGAGLKQLAESDYAIPIPSLDVIPLLSAAEAAQMLNDDEELVG